MNISIIGTGYVGIVSSACFAKLGNKVVCVDIDQDKIDMINKGVSPIYEEGLDDILKENKDNIEATNDYHDAINSTDVTFICVGTPYQDDGSIDLSYVGKVVEEIGRQLKSKDDWHLVVVKSTVVPGTTRDLVLPILERFSGKKVGDGFGLTFKPGTDDIRDSRSILIVKKLLELGIGVKVFDPKAMENFKNLFPDDVVYCSSADEILDSDAVIIATKWKDFKKLDYSGKIVIDGRRLKNAEQTAKIYEGVCW